MGAFSKTELVFLLFHVMSPYLYLRYLTNLFLIDHFRDQQLWLGTAEEFCSELDSLMHLQSASGGQVLAGQGRHGGKSSDHSSPLHTHTHTHGPHSNPWNLWIYYLTWQRGVKIADEIKVANQLI